MRIINGSAQQSDNLQTGFGDAMPQLLEHQKRRRKVAELSLEERARREEGWNSSIYIPMPLAFKGLVLRRDEPWSHDATAFNQADSAARLLQQHCDSTPTKPSVYVPLSKRIFLSAMRDADADASWTASDRKQAKKQARKGDKQPKIVSDKPWDATPHRSVPWALKGLDVYTREPWGLDSKQRFYDISQAERKELLKPRPKNLFANLSRKEREALLRPTPTPAHRHHWPVTDDCSTDNFESQESTQDGLGYLEA